MKRSAAVCLVGAGTPEASDLGRAEGQDLPVAIQ